MPKTTAAELENWGNIASDAFMHKQVPLNESIIKIANDNRLNAEQIQRVCEFANFRAFDDKIKTASDKRLEFPLADYKVVLASAKNKPDIEVGTESHESDLSKLSSYRSNEKTASIEDMFTYTDEDNRFIEKTAGFNGLMATKEDIYAGLEKLAAYKKELDLATIEYDSKDYSIKEAMTTMVKDLIGEGHSFEDLYKAAVASVPAEKLASIKNLFEDVGERLKQAGVIHHYKLAFDRLLCKAFDIVKTAEVKSLTPERRVQRLKARNSLTMLIGEYMTNQDDRAMTHATVDGFEPMYNKIREVAKENLKRIEKEVK